MRVKARNITKRFTIDLDDHDLANIDIIRECRGFSAMSDALRHGANFTARACRREMVEDAIETGALKAVRDRRVGYDVSGERDE